MSSPEWSAPTDDSFYEQVELSETPNDIYIYAPAIYGQDTKREELKEELPGIVVEDDEEDVIKVSYYADENGITEDKVLEVVQGIDGDAYIKN